MRARKYSFHAPRHPTTAKTGLAGGPLIVSILISRFGPHYKLITYTTMSANLMVREIGIALFLACVGLGAGKGFIETIVNEGATFDRLRGYHHHLPITRDRTDRTLRLQAKLLHADRYSIGSQHQPTRPRLFQRPNLV